MSLIRLIELDAGAFLEALDAGATQQRFGVRVSHDAAWLRAGLEQTVAFEARVVRASPWGAYLAVDDANGEVVAICGFKSAPTAEGVIEIAYGTLPTFEGKGYATAAAGELIRIARGSPLVRCVIAHTLPQRNASCRVLEKNGMRCVGEVIDPEDGKVWRWEMPVTPSSSEARPSSVQG